jgi:hypothetical protein
MIMGLYNVSFLIFVSGIYNIGLSIAKAVAVKAYHEINGKAAPSLSQQPDNIHLNKQKEYRYYQLVGIIVLIASTAYTIGSIRVLVGERSATQYSTVTMVGIGCIIAVEIIISMQGIFTWRREKQPILEAIKLTSLISSLIGLVLVQTVILSHDGSEPNIYFDYGGIFFGVISLCISLYMIVQAKKKTFAAD